MTNPDDRDEWIALQVARAPAGLVDSFMDFVAPLVVADLTEQVTRGELPPPHRRRRRVA